MHSHPLPSTWRSRPRDWTTVHVLPINDQEHECPSGQARPACLPYQVPHVDMEFRGPEVCSPEPINTQGVTYIHLPGTYKHKRVTDLQAPLRAQVVGVQKHVDLLVGAGGDVGEETIAGGSDAAALAQEREAVQVLKTCACRGTSLGVFNDNSSA